MSEICIVQIGMNDSLQDTIRKCNENFKRVSSNQRRESSADVRKEASRADAALAGAVDEINNALAIAVQQINQTLEQAKEELDKKYEDLSKLIAPPVGTYMSCTVDPSTYWKSTTWERIAEGNFIIAAGDTYKSGSAYGANEITLTTDQIPNHSHVSEFDFTVYDTSNPHGTGASVIKGTSGVDKDGSAASPQNAEYRPAHWYNSYEKSTGGGKAHSNIPKSIAVPLWKRTK